MASVVCTSPSLRDVELGEAEGDAEDETIDSKDIDDSSACEARSEEERFRDIVDLTSSLLGRKGGGLLGRNGGGLLDDSRPSGRFTISIGKKQSFSSSSKNDGGGRVRKLSKNIDSEAEYVEGWKTRGGKFAWSLTSSRFPSRRSQGSPDSCAILK